MRKENNKESAADITIENHGSIFVMQPHSPEARQWIDWHVDGEAQRWGGGVVVEPRFAPELIAAMLDYGFTVR
jgi:hypothetical protein